MLLTLTARAEDAAGGPASPARTGRTGTGVLDQNFTLIAAWNERPAPGTAVPHCG